MFGRIGERVSSRRNCPPVPVDTEVASCSNIRPRMVRLWLNAWETGEARRSTGRTGSAPTMVVMSGCRYTTAPSAVPCTTCRCCPRHRPRDLPAVAAAGRRWPTPPEGSFGAWGLRSDLQSAPDGFAAVHPRPARAPGVSHRLHQCNAPSPFGGQLTVEASRGSECRPVRDGDMKVAVVGGESDRYRAPPVPQPVGHQLGGDQTCIGLHRHEIPPGQHLPYEGAGH